MLGLYAAFSQAVYEVSAASLTPVQLRVVEREWVLTFLRDHQEARLDAMQCVCREYRSALQNFYGFRPGESVAARLGRAILEFGHQIREGINHH